MLVQSRSITPKPQPAAMADVEVEEDDLDNLDVPDIPSGKPENTVNSLKDALIILSRWSLNRLGWPTFVRQFRCC